jgi:hypothetical protein
VRSLTSFARRFSALAPAGLLSLILLSTTGCHPAPPETLPAIIPWQGEQITANAYKLTSTEPDADGAQLMSVSTAEDGAWIIVNFRAPVKLAQTWNEGNIMVIDELNGRGYNQIPVAPVIGPLFSKPKSDGQPGYAMLVNPDGGVKVGSTVTVVLGNYKRLHVEVK